MGGIRKSVFLAGCTGSLGANPVSLAGLTESAGFFPCNGQLGSYTRPNASAAVLSSKELLPSGGRSRHYTEQGLDLPNPVQTGKCSLRDLKISTCPPNKI